MKRVPCTTWPCPRCDRAGRTSWKSRERWHADRRDRRYGIAELVIVVAVALLLATLAFCGSSVNR